MSLFLDVALVVIFVLTVVNNYRYGFICSIIRMARFFVSLFVAFLLSDGIIQFVTVFALSFVLLTLALMLLRKIKIPVITKADKILGLVLGAFLGIFYVSAIASATFGVIELLSSAGFDVSEIYDGSTVFKFVYDLGFFDFIFGALEAQI